LHLAPLISLQGWGDIGYNDPTFVTPTIDFFARKGITLTNYYTHVSPPSPLSVCLSFS
jgi:arylsulfatase A-like enzyme